MSIRVNCARVPKYKGDFYRKKLLEAQLINNKFIITHNDRFLYIPLSTLPTDELLSTLPELDIVEFDFESYPDHRSDYRSYLEVPIEVANQLPTSFDIIGSIAIIKLPYNLLSFQQDIGSAIIKAHKNIKTVANDKGVKGNLRIRDIDVIAGELNTETIHKEYNIKLSVDVAKVYFSPRLSSEHYRISQLVKPQETILDMFAGIGPFSIMIAKYSKAERIFAIDLNSFAIKYLIRNIDQNKVTNVFPLEGDVRLMIRKIPKVNRIIMNLPMGAHEYLPEAFAVLEKIGVVHYHEIMKAEELSTKKSWLKDIAKQNRFKLISSTEHNLGSYSPTLNHYCIDLTLERLNSTGD